MSTAKANFNIGKSESQIAAGEKFQYQYVEFLDKTVIQIYYNGEIDSTIDIQLPSLIDNTMDEEEEEELITSKIKTSFIIGDSNNFKTLILATQLGKLLLSLNKKKPVIFSTSSKIFKREDQDFMKLMHILSNIREIV